MFTYLPTMVPGYHNMEHCTFGPDGSPMTADPVFYTLSGT